MSSHRRRFAIAAVMFVLGPLLTLSSAEPAGAVAGPCTGDNTNIYVDSSGLVTGLVGQNCTSLVIPPTFTFPSGGPTVPVTGIEIDAFANSSLTSVQVPASVTSIRASAFSGSTSLTSVSFASGSQLQTIGNSAFAGATSLASFSVPASVTSIGASAFYNDTALTSLSFASGSQLQTIGNMAFANTRLTTLVLPDSLLTLGLYSFKSVTTLRTVTMGSSLTTISMEAFDGDTSLTGTLTIPDSVTTIGARAFDKNNFTGLHLGSGVTAIGNAAFRSASYPGLMTGQLVIPPATDTLSFGAFDGQGFTSLVLNEGLRSIGNTVFRLPNLTGTVNLPSTVRSIGSGAFESTGVTSLILNDGLQEISDRAFALMSGLSGILHIPATVTTVGATIVTDNASLDAVHFDGAKPATISDDAFGANGPIVTFATGTSGWGGSGSCGENLNVGNFTVTGVCAPTVTAVLPNLLPSAGGVVSISGSNFMAGLSVSRQGSIATGVKVESSTKAQATIAAAAAGTSSLTVTNKGVRSATLDNAVRYVPFDPVPTGVTAEPQDGAAKVSWTIPPGASIASVGAYTVTSTPDGRTCSTTGSVCTVAGLTNGTSYTFTVILSGDAFSSARSSASAAITPVAAPSTASTPTTTTAPTAATSTARRTPGRVVGLGPSAINSRGFTLRWGVPVTTGGSPITSYRTRIRIAGRWKPWFGMPVRRGQRSYSRMWTGLAPGKVYTVQVRAVSARGAGLTAQIAVSTSK